MAVEKLWGLETSQDKVNTLWAGNITISALYCNSNQSDFADMAFFQEFLFIALREEVEKQLRILKRESNGCKWVHPWGWGVRRG